MARKIFNRNPDPRTLLDELHFSGERDLKGLPLGPVTRHAEDRFVISFQVLCLFAVARDLNLFARPVTVDPVGDPPQDKQVGGDYQAAHALPSNLKVTPASGSPGPLYGFFRNPFSRTWIELNVFAKTVRVHRLTNLADSYSEKAGLRRALADACAAVANSDRTPMSVFQDDLVPNYLTAIRAAQAANLAELTAAERQEAVRRPVVDRFGAAATARPADTRVSTADADARVANRGALIQIFDVYASMNTAPRHLLVEAQAQADAMRLNERSV